MSHLYEHLRGLEAEIDNLLDAMEAEKRTWIAYDKKVTRPNGTLAVPKRQYFKEQDLHSKRMMALEDALCRLEDELVPRNPCAELARRLKHTTVTPYGTVTDGHACMEEHRDRVRAAIALVHLSEVPIQCKAATLKD